MKVVKTLDPIQTLRNFTIQKKLITLKDNYLIFDKQGKISTFIYTAWVSPYKNRYNINKQYTLGSIWFLLQYKDKPMSQYIIKRRQSIWDLVDAQDRQQTIAFFTGKKNFSHYINQKLKVELLLFPLQDAVKPFIQFQYIPQLRQKLKGEVDTEQLSQKIDELCIPVGSKIKTLRCPHQSYTNLLPIAEKINNVTALIHTSVQ